MYLKDFIVDRVEKGKNAALCGLMCKTGITEFIVFVNSRTGMHSLTFLGRLKC